MTQEVSSPGVPREEVTLGELLGVARRRAVWLVAGLLLGGLGAALAFALSALRFEARATLVYPPETSSADLLARLDLPLGLGALSGASAVIGAEIEALRARPLVEEVLRAEGPPAPEGRCARLDDLARQSAWKSWLRPARAPAALALEVLAWPFPDEEREGIVLTFLAGERLEVRREGWFAGQAEVGPYRDGESFERLGVRLVLRASEGLEGRSFRLRCPTRARAASEFLETLRVREEPTGSSAVRLVVPDADAARSARLANRLVELYLADNQARRRRLAGRPVEFLEVERARIHSELEAAEERLLAFGHESGLLGLPGAAAEVVDKLSQVDLERAKLELARRAAEETLARLRSGELGTDQLAALEATGVFSHDLVEPLIGLVARREELLRENTEAHPEVQRADAAIQQRIAALDGVLESERWKLSEQADSLEGLVQSYLTELEGFPDIQIEYARRRRAVEALTQIDQFLVGRIEQAKITQASSVPAADVLEWAEVPFEPEGPRAWLFLAAGLALGLGVGLGTAFLREYHERPLVAPGRVESLLGVECLVLRRRARGPQAAETLLTLRALLRRDGAPERALLVVPVGRRARDADLAAELAGACARAGERVLLVDADARAGRLHERFGRPPAPGLGELLAQAAPGSEPASEPSAGTLQPTEEAGLTLLARGATPASSLVELARRLEVLGAGFERLLLAAPPAARSAAAYELAASGAGLVLACAGASEEELVRVARRLVQCGGELRAAVLLT